MDLGLGDKVAIVTGGGQGIGRTIARTLAAEGAAVAVNDLIAERAEGVAAEIRAQGGRALGVAADVTDRAAVAAMVERTVAEFGTVHILVNNAGIPVPIPGEGGGSQFDMGSFVDSDPARWDRIMGVVTEGVMNCTRAVLPHMCAQRYGKIVSIVSDAGIVGEPHLAPYSMAKAGVAGFSRALAKELGRYRINVNCVSPGATPPEGADMDAARLQGIGRLYPMVRGWERYGIPSDVADPVVFLCSDRAIWVTGAVVRASGGYSIA
jgi:NAD(P)-dependent dehydrogenase (short-subunit alcohol dehydrogenase family)